MARFWYTELFENASVFYVVILLQVGVLWSLCTSLAEKMKKRGKDGLDVSVISCIRDRRSIFPSGFLRNPPPLDPAIIQSMLDAALWAPFHGKCYKGNQHPAKFVVLGKRSMVEMQELTLKYYDKNWKTVGWGSGGHLEENDNSEKEYQAWRKMTEDEIHGRWGPCTHMIAIIMRRQAGPKRLPLWEEAAAVATATHNMHLQSTKFPHVACYWSSWHDAARDSYEMKEFLCMESEDRCMGFFIVAQNKRPGFKDRRKRERSLMAQEWRP